MVIRSTEEIVNSKGDWWMDTRWIMVDDDIINLFRIISVDNELIREHLMNMNSEFVNLCVGNSIRLNNFKKLLVVNDSIVDEKSTVLGDKIVSDFSLRLCCNVCGFPVDLPRNPVLLTSNILSLIEYNDDVCLSCGHQKDGSTIPVVYNHWQGLCNKFISERALLCKFLLHYTYLDFNSRRNVCVSIPRFMVDKDADSDVLEPFSWNVVYDEVINNTKLSKTLLRDIDWNEVKKNA